MGNPTLFRFALRAVVAISMVAATASGFSQKVVVDAWFNSQQRPGPSGKMEYFHYKWNDTTNSGFSLFGKVFNDHGGAVELVNWLLQQVPRVQ